MSIFQQNTIPIQEIFQKVEQILAIAPRIPKGESHKNRTNYQDAFNRVVEVEADYETVYISVYDDKTKRRNIVAKTYRLPYDNDALVHFVRLTLNALVWRQLPVNYTWSPREVGNIIQTQLPPGAFGIALNYAAFMGTADNQYTNIVINVPFLMQRLGEMGVSNASEIYLYGILQSMSAQNIQWAVITPTE